MGREIRILKAAEPWANVNPPTEFRNIFPIGAVLTIITLALVLTALDSISAAQHYPPDFKFVQVPNPLDGHNPAHRLPKANEPAVGQSFKDPNFGTILTRATERGLFRHEYSRFDPFNKNQSMIVLLDTESGSYFIFRTDGPNFADPKNLVARIEWSEPRWDQTDPNRLWGLDGFKIVTMDVGKNRIEVVKDFAQDAVLGKIIKSEPDLYRITTKGEGEPSLDFRFWALALQGSHEDYRLRYLFCWDRDQDKLLGHVALSTAEADLIDWVGMSPLGKWVIVGGDADRERKTSGLSLVDTGFARWHRLAGATAHSDVGLDSRGREVLVMQNSSTDHIDLIPLAPGGKSRPLAILFYNSEDPEGFSGGVHISCNTPGYCVISTYNSPAEPARNWLDRTITLIGLDPSQPRAWHLATVQNTTGTYWEETHATISRDGSRIVWASNWGKNIGEGRVFVMHLTMPPGWRDLAR